MSASAVVGETTYLELSEEGEGAHKCYEVTVAGTEVLVRRQRPRLLPNPRRDQAPAVASGPGRRSSCSVAVDQIHLRFLWILRQELVLAQDPVLLAERTKALRPQFRARTRPFDPLLRTAEHRIQFG